MSPEGQVLKQRRGIEVSTYLTHWKQALCVTCQIPFKYDKRMYDPRTYQLNHNLNDIAQLVKQHKEKSTVYFGNDRVMMFVAVYITATQINDSYMMIWHHKYW